MHYLLNIFARFTAISNPTIQKPRNFNNHSRPTCSRHLIITLKNTKTMSMSHQVHSLTRRHIPCSRLSRGRIPTNSKHSAIDSCRNRVDYLTSSGSGCISAFIARVFNIFCISTDVNVLACECTMHTASINNVSVDALNTSFAGGLNRLNGKVDLLVFNPPYVVTSPEELGSRSIQASWAGGIDGRQVIDKFMPLVSVMHLIQQLLSPHGLFYLVVIRENKPPELMDHCRKAYGLHSRVVMFRKAGIEGLSVISFAKHPFNANPAAS